MFSKKSRFISIAALSIAVVALAVFVTLFMLRHSPVRVAAAQNRPPAPAPEPTPQLPPGTITYTAKAQTTAAYLARLNLTNSSYMTVQEFETAIREANGGKSTFKKGDLRRAIEAVQATGASVARIEIDRSGKLVVVSSRLDLSTCVRRTSSMIVRPRCSRNSRSDSADQIS